MLPNGSFKVVGFPRTEFGPGVFRAIPGLVKGYGGTVLLVTGARSLKLSGRYGELTEGFRSERVSFFELTVRGEPSPDLVDAACERFRDKNIDVVLSVGGGSVIDAGKAVSAMLPVEGGVEEYLEGVGNRTHPGVKVPFMAAPTTSGTGSEATANAVLSRVGHDGYKVSLRHHNFVPDLAIVDPELTLECPPEITAAAGMDALTQLLGSYVSTASNPVTDALAPGGIRCAGGNLPGAVAGDSGDVAVRSGMSYASLISGITLASAGLGIVHGFASSIGGLFEIPHGVICGTLVAEATSVNIDRLKGSGEAGVRALEKYARAGSFLTGEDFPEREASIRALISTLRKWTKQFRLPRLGGYGVAPLDLERIVEATSLKNNPVTLSREDMREILESRL
jgi:alcohol dehydrogenase